MGKLSEEQKALLIMTYNDFGKLVEFQYDVYGFIGSNNKVRLVNTDTLEILNKELSIKYIGDNIIILGNYNMGVRIKFVILDRKTLNTLYEDDKELVKIGNIIYEREYNEYLYGSNIIRNVFNLKGKLIGTLNLEGELIIEDTDNPKYYIVSNKKLNSAEYDNNIALYDEDNESFKIIKNFSGYDVECIGFGLYKFSRYDDYRDTFMLDIINDSV